MVLFANQRIEVADLGEAAAVDGAVSALLSQLKNPGSDPRLASQSLYTKIFKPLEASLAGITRLYLSLDGSLNLIPYAALHDGKSDLLDRYELHYLTSGRDLLRELAERPRQPGLVLADPDFAAGEAIPLTAAPRPLNEITRSLYNNLQALPQLPGARKEAQILAQLLPGAVVLTGKQATEPALRHAHAPQLIHLATHGIFFTEEAPEELPTQVAARGLAPLFNQARAPEVTVQVLDSKPDDFASRSALIFAGASNAQRSVAADQDGVISEEEVRALNLWGTELVVLSACDTGRAAVQAGQGVYGLRRAFFVAGAETLVTSLWQVADRETGELMKSFYEKLLKEGQPRLGALQEAMKEVRRTRPHPYYWAPFIAIGRDAPLSGLVKQP